MKASDPYFLRACQNIAAQAFSTYERYGYTKETLWNALPEPTQRHIQDFVKLPLHGPGRDMIEVPPLFETGS